MTTPSIMMATPTPKPIQKQFHGKKLLVWEGLVKVTEIQGWVKNRRLDLEVKRFKDANAGREPSNNEILEIMKSVPEFRLKELADDIRINGVRQHIVIASDGRLLDGNRRYYAVRYLLESMRGDDPLKSDYEAMPVWVLNAEASAEDEKRILVQENFYPSLKVEWPDYVKAQDVYAELQKNVPIEALTQRYHWSQAKIREAKDIMEMIDEFLIFATTVKTEDQDGLGLQETEAERLAAEKYQHFNEAKKSFKERLDRDLEFKQQFFRWIYENKFASFAEVRVAEKAWDNPKARRVLLSNDPKAGKKAKALIDFEKRFEEELVEVDNEIEEFVKFLGQLTTEQKAQIGQESLIKLKSALGIVTRMVEPDQGKKQEVEG